jgi:[ribosomal protein S5]-alanine N-acetyltransferase
MAIILRPLTLDDAPDVQTLAGAYEVALNTLLVPHPYPDGAAEEWIANAGPHTFAVDDGRLVGAAGLVMKGDEIAEVGYWIGVPYWNRGYASAAAREILRYGFEECELHRIFAGHFARNPASGKVMRKAGMTFEGTLRQHVKKWGEYLDVSYYGILREEWLSARGTAGGTAATG